MPIISHAFIASSPWLSLMGPSWFLFCWAPIDFRFKGLGKEGGTWGRDERWGNSRNDQVPRLIYARTYLRYKKLIILQNKRRLVPLTLRWNVIVAFTSVQMREYEGTPCTHHQLQIQSLQGQTATLVYWTGLATSGRQLLPRLTSLWCCQSLVKTLGMQDEKTTHGSDLDFLITQNEWV